MIGIDSYIFRDNILFMKRGFTLVELSIVLVIIGLLIGGILAAQSLIESAKVSKSVIEMQRYKALVSNFKVKYNSLPGDSLVMPNPGDGDGSIEYPGGGAQGEWLRAWQHLSDSGDLKESYTGLVSGGAIPAVGGENVPKSEAFEDAAYCLWKPVTLVGYRGNYNYLAYAVPRAGSLCTDGFMTAQNAVAIDTKMDDGEPDSGYVIVYNASYTTFTPGCLTNVVGGANLTSADYDITNPNSSCALQYYIDKD